MYGILKTSSNTGADSELSMVFTAPLSITNNAPIFDGDTMNLKSVTSSQDAQRWEIEAGISPIHNPENVLVHSALNNVNTFYVRMPQINISRKMKSIAGATLALSGSANANVSNITIIANGNRGLDVANINAGEFITFTGDSKVYMIASIAHNLNTGVSVSSTVELIPKLLTSKTNGTVIQYGSLVTMRAKYDASYIRGIKFADGMIIDQGSTKIIEKL
jgi:hypothetical protein